MKRYSYYKYTYNHRPPKKNPDIYFKHQATFPARRQINTKELISQIYSHISALRMWRRSFIDHMWYLTRVLPLLLLLLLRRQQTRPPNYVQLNVPTSLLPSAAEACTWHSSICPTYLQGTDCVKVCLWTHLELVKLNNFTGQPKLLWCIWVDDVGRGLQFIRSGSAENGLCCP